MSAAVVDVTSWEDLTSAGRRAADDMDRGRFMIGLLALEVEKSYGKDTIGQFAIDIHVTKDSVQDYRSVCQYYQKSIYIELMDECPNLRYSHFKTAKRFGNVDTSLAFLREANDNAWTCEVTRIEAIKRLGRPLPPRKLYEGEVSAGQLAPLMLQLDLDLSAKVRMVIYEVQP